MLAFVEAVLALPRLMNMERMGVAGAHEILLLALPVRVVVLAGEVHVQVASVAVLFQEAVELQRDHALDQLLAVKPARSS
jgi:hypothetical protein